MKTRSKTFILEKEKAWEPAGEGVVRQIMGYDGQVMLVKVKFETGAIGTPHTHYHTQTTYVASGKFEFTVNGEKQIVETGDGIYIEPDAEHGCTCLEAGILIDCFSPIRADFFYKGCDGTAAHPPLQRISSLLHSHHDFIIRRLSYLLYGYQLLLSVKIFSIV